MDQHNHHPHDMSHPIQIVIVEDEDMVAARLQRLIGQVLEDRPFELRHLGTLDQAREEIGEPDVLFLDLNLDGQDGFNLLHWSAAGPQQTIVASANTDRAMEAFELGVADFVPKPFQLDRIRTALARALDQSDPDDVNEHFINRLCVRIGARTRVVPTSEIRWISRDHGFTELFLRDNSSLDHEWSLDRLTKALGPDFIRIHRSHIVAVDEVAEIQSLRRSQYRASLKGGQQLPVGRSRIESLRTRLGISS